VFTAVTLKWINIGATKYEYCLATTEAACAPDSTGWVSTLTATSVTVTDLLYATTYYWQVRATTADGVIYADKGALWDFTTTFNKLAPENHSQDQHVNSLTLSWEEVDIAIGYQYCLVTAESCVDADYVAAAGTSVTVNGLSYGTRYYWQVRANISTTATAVWLYANGSSTALWRFTTEDLEKISPENGAIDQPITNLILDWGEVTDAIEYQYCLSLDGICLENDWDTTTTESTITLASLAYSTTFYWQVRANVGTVELPVWLYADAGSFWYFTTQAAPVVVP
jgi:hypothetical protein